MTEHFNKLTEAEAERLSILAEECAEVIQVITKIQRHGYNSYHPDKPLEGDNRFELEREIGHVANAIMLLTANSDINEKAVNYWRKDKFKTIWQWLHHNEAP